MLLKIPQICRPGLMLMVNSLFHAIYTVAREVCVGKRERDRDRETETEKKKKKKKKKKK